MQPGEQVASSAHVLTVAAGAGFATRRRGEDCLMRSRRQPRHAAGPRRRARSSRPAACACTTCARATGRRSSTSTAPRAPSTTSRSRSAPRLARELRGRRDRPAGLRLQRPAGDGENSPQAQAAVLRAAAAELGLERPLLVGHSLGAAVALAWALDAPDDVAAVVTLGGYVLPLGGPPPGWSRSCASPRRLRGVGALGRSRLGRPLVESAVQRAFSPARPPPEYARLAPRARARSRATCSATATTARRPRRASRRLRPRYPGLAVPLVIVVGDAGPHGAAGGLRAAARARARAPSSCACPAPATCRSSRRRTPCSAAVDRAAELGRR